MNRMARRTVQAIFAVVVVLIGTWLAPSGAAEAATQDQSCTTFYDWSHYGRDLSGLWHQHHSGSLPWFERRDTSEWDWWYMGTMEADGRQHTQLAPGWTLGYNSAHHERC